MSLLDKITGLAIKAKDNVISKTFISKDKRLEQSLSETIKVNDIYFEKMSTYGLPSAVSVVTFDCVAGLLAVAEDSNHGYIKVFGKGISTTIKLPNPVGIKHLQFKTGFPILVVIDKSNNIITIDLRTKSIRHILPAQEIITTQAYCTGTDWLFIGYANGYIDVFDIMQGTITPYQIPNLLETLEEKVENNIVVELQLHPTELNTLLIGYESTIFIWNIRENTIRKTFSLLKLDKSNPYRNGNLTSVAWSPNGSRFICGYDDGCLHLWDIKNDQKPIYSRKLSETFLPHHHHQQTKEKNIVEPIYQLSWYANTTTQKSYIVVAGGTDSKDLKGLNILEYDLDSDSKEPKKQSIMPLPIDLSHFIILSTDPYYLGLHNPFGIAIVTEDFSLKAYSFDHGYPELKLPPALEFIGPNVLNACHLPQFPTDSFKKLSTITSIDRNTKYFPITGGVTGPDHVYHVESNDLLLTIHKGEIVKFWDASYTALRPLSHLTIHCLDHLENPSAFICCIDLNKENGSFTIGFSDGTILVYDCQIEQQEEPGMDPRLKSRHEEFINHCDDTLKEISNLLEDMGSDTESEHPVVATDASSSATAAATVATATVDTVESQDNTNPFITPSPTHHQIPKKLPAESLETPLPKKSKFFKKLEISTEKPGFHASLRIQLNSPIKSVVSIGESIVAVALDNGSISVLDIHKQMVLFTHNIAQSDFHNTVVIPAANLKSEVAVEIQEADPIPEEQKKPATVTTLSFFNTYSPTKLMTTTTQLFVGLSNGHVYQFNLALLIEKGPSIAATDLMNDYLSLKVTPDTSLLEMFIIDLKGKSQLATKELEPPLSKESSHHSTESVPEDELSPKPSSVISSNSSVASNNTSKRMAAIGKAEYRHQESPHLIVCISLTGISVVLSGFNVKLFSREFKDIKVIRGEIIESHNGVCLCLILDNGKLAFYSLPTLEFMLEMNLPKTCLLDRLHESSLARDGRVIFWSGKYELEQYSFIPKPNFPSGDSVILFDSQKQMPPHPSLLNQQQRPKKSWLDTVAGAFTREPLTLAEMDLLMGRVPVEDAQEVRRQKIEAYKAKQYEPSPSKGVFAELGDKMNERGEKLNQLDKKFEDMNAASGDFLKAVREYNERQERKKWWEF